MEQGNQGGEFPSGSRILVTGSSGWLGRHLVPLLREKGYQTIGLDVAPGVHTTVRGSVADRAVVDEVFQEHGVDAVVHCGALHKPDIVRCTRQAFVDVNVTGTLNLLEAAAAAGHDRFVFTSTTSLMVSREVHAGVRGGAQAAFWMDEDFGPIRPRNIYGVTKCAAEHLCHLFAQNHGLDIAVMRAGRFFAEEDDSQTAPSGPNLKANEFLNRRLSVADAAGAHLAALHNIPSRGCRTYVLAARTPFRREDVGDLVQDAPSVVARYFPAVEELYDARGWSLPARIERVYDSSRLEHELGFRPAVDFEAILAALAAGRPLPYQHDPSYISPKETDMRDAC